MLASSRARPAFPGRCLRSVNGGRGKREALLSSKNSTVKAGGSEQGLQLFRGK